MAKVDFVFFLVGIFCFFSIMFSMRDQANRVAKYEEIMKKKDLYANRIIEQKRREALAKAAEERKVRQKLDMETMTNTMEVLSNISDQEVMRKTRITDGKY